MLDEGGRKVRLSQDSLPNIHFHNRNERKVGTLFYPHPKLYGVTFNKLNGSKTAIIGLILGK